MRIVFVIQNLVLRQIFLALNSMQRLGSETQRLFLLNKENLIEWGIASNKI